MDSDTASEDESAVAKVVVSSMVRIIVLLREIRPSREWSGEE